MPISITLSTYSLNCHLSSRGTNWTHFKTKVSNALATTFSLKTEEKILIATQFLTTSMQTAAWESTPPTNAINKQILNKTSKN